MTKRNKERGTGPRWLDTFGNSFMATLEVSERRGATASAESSVQAKEEKKGTKILLLWRLIKKRERVNCPFPAGGSFSHLFFHTVQFIKYSPKDN